MNKDRMEVIAYWQRLAEMHYARAREHMEYADSEGYETAKLKQALARDCAQLVFIKRGLLELVLC